MDKRCSKCKRTKREGLFWKSQDQCIACQRKRDRSHDRRSHVKRTYGLTVEEYDALMAAPCAICGDTESRMHLDHDHTTGEVREPLCHCCNLTLGLMKDDPERLEAAAAYLREHDS